ncbi:MAG: sugar phosphate isomerase/epimerase family protein [Planctomycetota bacterium]|jgi:sugar phosphate isomerase/epimerase
MSTNKPMYMGTILLDVNRWKRPEKVPSYRVSEWVGRFREAGFDGMELWQYHATRCGEEELEALLACGWPPALFNIYPTFTGAEMEEIAELSALAGKLGAGGVKFNIGAEPERREEYLANLKRWREVLPAGVRPMCECHPGTVIEEPAEARRFFDELDSDGWEIIVHPFSRIESLEEWLKLFGPAVTHAHLQMREERAIVRFDSRPDVARKAADLLGEYGFAGSLTLEFAAGTGSPGENIEDLFRTALDDLAFVRELIA